MTERLNSNAMVAERLSVSDRVVDRLVATGELRSVKIGTRRLIPESVLTEYLEQLQAHGRSA
jgi:excisionase family DNA binding protein